VRGITLFLDQLAEYCPEIRSVWMIGRRADDETLGSNSHFGWDLVALADASTLRRLRSATDLHRSDVRLWVVSDANRFELAWGGEGRSGSLSGWHWKPASEREAYYSESVPGQSKDREFERQRRKAICLRQDFGLAAGTGVAHRPALDAMHA